MFWEGAGPELHLFFLKQRGSLHVLQRSELPSGALGLALGLEGMFWEGAGPELPPPQLPPPPMHGAFAAAEASRPAVKEQGVSEPMEAPMKSPQDWWETP